ncbi:MAG: glycosyltransferase family 4 protein [Candidatus Omnitrophica bacterium]|nr:glycosyltransferase family 4 protein [Candidatus Omnitrophota bacterium]
MVRILFVIENVFFGGGERSFSQIINSLDKSQYDIFVACNPGGGFSDRIKDSAKIIPLSLKNLYNLNNFRYLSQIIQQRNIDIVHSQGLRSDFFTRMAARDKRVFIVNTIVMPPEGYDVNLLQKALYVSLDRYSERFVDKFIVVSEALKNRLIKVHKVPADKVVRIYNGVEISSENREQRTENRIKIRKELGIAEDVRLVGTIGRLVWQKGFKYFIEAAKILDTRCPIPDTRYLIVGEGPLRGKLESLAGRLGIKERVIFTGFRSDIKEILQALDIFVLPSIREGQPIVLLEAMAEGVLIIATDIEGVKETIQNGTTGILVSAQDPMALARAIIETFDNRERSEKITRQAKLAVNIEFNIKDKVAQYQLLYEELVAQSGKEI